MPLTPGTRLGPYEILAPIGAGGMGEVYKARDTRLNRFVAIKVLPAERLADEGRKLRFIQEAQAASALNHPNIISIYDIAVDNGRDYIVMEFVPGKTLDGLIQRTGMRLSELLKIAIQVAEGIGVAHGAGIIHRDLKPSNIMISESGLVKILDFGLAKLIERDAVTEDAATRTLKLRTDEGTVMGTAAYMSPEQAEGKLIDARSDIFSFGAVLYEMATGRRAFVGDSQAATMAAVLNKEPKPAREAAPDVPGELERVINRCLRKDPEKRQQHMTDVKVLLEELREESESGKLATAAGSKSLRRWAWVAVAATLAIVAGGGGWWLSSGHQEEPPRVVPLTTLAGSEGEPSFSPDGNQIVFSWDGEKQDNSDLYVKMIGSPTALRLTTDAADDWAPAWSPDGRQIAFLKSGPHGGVYLISPLGGPEQKIADLRAIAGPAWSPDSNYLVVVTKNRPDQKLAPEPGSLILVPVQGGEPRRLLTSVPDGWYSSPAFSPVDRSLAFASCRGSTNCDLLVVGLDAESLPRGKPRQLTSVRTYIAGIAWTPDGRSLIYSAGSLTERFLFRIDAAGGGEPKRLEIASQGAYSPAVALKGNRLAFSRSLFDTDIWRLQVGGKPQPLLVSTMQDSSAQFSADGRRIVFGSARSGDRMAIWLANADGAGLVQLTRGPEDYQGSPCWSPDGSWIAFDARGKDSLWHIKVVESSGGQARQLTRGTFSSNVPSWSHDGKWIYFNSDRSGRREIWRMPFHGGAAEQITGHGGNVALESTDGKTLYYIKAFGDGPLFAQPIGGGEEKQIVEKVAERGFAVFEDGIYYLSAGSTVAGRYEIRFHEFATGRSRLVSPIAGQLSFGFSVSPDRKTFLFTLVPSSGSDLMLIENFR